LPVHADEASTALLHELRSAVQNGPGSPAARAAWDKLVQLGPSVLPNVLVALDTPDTVAANWLRTAFDRILDRALQTARKQIDVDALLAFAQDPKRQGRARRLALDVVEQLRPGTRERLTPGWFDDPEFRYEAIADAVQRADQLAKDGSRGQAVALY